MLDYMRLYKKDFDDINHETPDFSKSRVFLTAVFSFSDISE